MWGSIIGAAASAAGGIAGNVIASKQAKKAKAELDSQRNANEDWYKRRYNESYLETAEAQRMLSEARAEADRQLSRSRGMQTVLGLTDESVDADRRRANAMIGDTTAQLAAQGTARKDAIESQYMNRAAQLSQQYQNLYNARAQAAGQAGSGAMQAGMGMVGADMQSYAQTGRGAFENWGKQKQK